MALFPYQFAVEEALSSHTGGGIHIMPKEVPDNYLKDPILAMGSNPFTKEEPWRMHMILCICDKAYFTRLNSIMERIASNFLGTMGIDMTFRSGSWRQVLDEIFGGSGIGKMAGKNYVVASNKKEGSAWVPVNVEPVSIDDLQKMSTEEVEVVFKKRFFDKKKSAGGPVQFTIELEGYDHRKCGFWSMTSQRDGKKGLFFAPNDFFRGPGTDRNESDFLANFQWKWVEPK